MKNALKTRLTVAFSFMVAAVCRMAARFEVASLRITLDGKLQALACVSDPAQRHAMRAETYALRGRLADAEARVIALQPKRSWRLA